MDGMEFSIHGVRRKRSTKKLKHTGSLLILGLKPLRSEVKGKHSIVISFLAQICGCFISPLCTTSHPNVKSSTKIVV